MSTYRRNVLVGLTMLIALGMLGWMILRFGGKIAQPFSGELIRVRFVSDRADGVSEGSGVYYKGVNVGRVIRVTRDQNLTDVWIDAEVEATPPLPGGTGADIRQASLLGSGSRIEIRIPPADHINGSLKAGDVIRADFVGLQFFPEEIKNLSLEVAAAARQFREANVVGNLNTRLNEVGQVLSETRKTLENANKIVADEKVRADITAAIQNIRASSDNVRQVTERADKIAQKMQNVVDNIDQTTKTANTELTDIAKLTKTRLEELAGIIQQTHQITTKINQGDGTASKLLNDPKLYEGLVDTTRELKQTIQDLQRLVQQWEEEGVTLKLK